jgi:lysophospholipase L1-like esterase
MVWNVPDLGKHVDVSTVVPVTGNKAQAQPQQLAIAAPKELAAKMVAFPWSKAALATVILKRIAAIGFFLFASALGLAQSTTITATQVVDGNGNVLVKGKWCFGSSCLLVVNGKTPTGATVPAGTANINISNSTGLSWLTVKAVTLTAGSFSWDTFVLGATQSAVGPQPPIIPAAIGASYLETYDSSTWSYLVAGWTKINAIKRAAPGNYSGVGVPTFFCTAPCTYTQVDAVPISAGAWAIIANPGDVTNNWQQQGGSGTGGTPTAADQAPVSTSPTLVTYTPLPDCANDGSHSLAYSTSTHTYSCATITGGWVTHTAGPLTPKQLVIGNGSGDVTVDPNASTDGAGNLLVNSVTGGGTTPGKASLLAGTGSIPALAANSAGFAAPVPGGTSYLYKLPATAVGGILHAAAPATGDGVNESVLTSSPVSLTADVAGLLPNGNLANPSTTVNGVPCTLGSACAPAPTLAQINALGAITNPTSGNSGTATALAATPTQCSGTTPLASGIAASGNANCTTAGAAGAAGEVQSSNGAGGFTDSGISAVAGALQVTSCIGCSNGVLLTGATADYNFLQGSGTVLTDSTGNGNNGTLGTSTLAPTWNATGLVFAAQQHVTLPAALNTTKTFFIAAYFNPLTSGTQPVNVYPTLVGSSLDTAGLNLLYAQEFGGIFPTGQAGAYVPSVFANGSVTTGGTTTLSGFHVLTYVLGTGGGNLDHLYIDGLEQSTYDRQGSSFGFQTTGNLFLGSSNTTTFNTSGFLGTMYRVRTYAVNTLTASQIQLLTGQIRGDVQSRGVPLAPLPVAQVKSTLNCIGDSITVGFGATSPFCSLLSLTNQAYTITNWGISGITLTAISGSEPNRVAPRCTTIFGPANALVFGGTNDFSTLSGATATTVFGSLIGEVQALKTAGCRVFVGTMLSRTGSSNGVLLDVDKNNYDAAILTKAKAAGADGIVDFAANPLLGADGAYSNLTYFQADGTHPTSTGQGMLATALSNSLNYYYGSKLSNPNIITTTTYQMLSGDGAITAAPTANAAYTAPDCTGPSGEGYVISNPQSAFTLTIIGETNQPINGLTTAITIPSNSTVTLHDVANPKVTSGCHWVM